MTSSRLFRNLWRINGILFLLAALLGLWILVFEIIPFLRAPRVQAVPTLDPAKADREIQKLGPLQEIPGTPYLRSELLVAPHPAGPYARRNHLFINTVTLETRWLLPSHQQLLLLSEFVRPGAPASDSGSSADGAPVRAIAYQVVNRDTNGDGLLTSDDHSLVAVSRADGTGWIVVVPEAEALVGTRPLAGNEQFLVVYRKDKKTFLVKVNLKPFEIPGLATAPAAAPAPSKAPEKPTPRKKTKSSR